ncbi:MAG: hypothetical protein COB02_18550 [Candidatus Cloacimonadota bacterium]|nr:MAG: hypothetical protein COB02_18550 [Candidatus Cloacimonadota bacterium]
MSSKQNYNYCLKVRLIIFSICILSKTYGEPYTPNLNDIIYTLPYQKHQLKINKLRKNYDKKKLDNNNLDKLLSLYITLGKKHSDPRLYGYAEALLKPYLKNKNLSNNNLIHWANILQHRHEFNLSLAILNTSRLKKSKKATPFLMKAVIYAGKGEYKNGLKECKQLIFRASHILTSTCIALMNSHLGRLNESYQFLKKIKAQQSRQTVQESLFSIGTLADMAFRLNSNELENYITEGLSLDSNDYYLLKLYVDYLLMNGRNEEALKLSTKHQKKSGMLVRKLLAIKNMNQKLPEKSVNYLDLKFKRMILLGENAHLRELVLFYLKIKKNKSRAWILAKQNWEIQKEPIDFRMLLWAGLFNSKESYAFCLQALNEVKFEDFSTELLIADIPK